MSSGAADPISAFVKGTYTRTDDLAVLSTSAGQFDPVWKRDIPIVGLDDVVREVYLAYIKSNGQTQVKALTLMTGATRNPLYNNVLTDPAETDPINNTGVWRRASGETSFDGDGETRTIVFAAPDTLTSPDNGTVADTQASATAAYSGASDYYAQRILQAYTTRAALADTNVLSGAIAALQGSEATGSVNKATMDAGPQGETLSLIGPLWSVYDPNPVNRGIFAGLPLSQGWLNSTDCAHELQHNKTSVCSIARDAGSACNAPGVDGSVCDTGWCGVQGIAVPAVDDPPLCSNSADFRSPGFTVVSFSIAAPYDVFATTTVAVTPGYPDTGTAHAFDVRAPESSALSTMLQASMWAGTTDGGTGLTSIEDGNMTCFAGEPVSTAATGTPYVYGAGTATGVPTAVVRNTLMQGTSTRALSAADTVSFEMCRLHQQLQKCTNGSAVCDAANCCDIGNSLRDACFRFAWPSFRSNCSRFGTLSESSLVFKPWPQYFNVVRGGGSNADVACAGTDDGQSCVLLSGITALPSSGEFAYEPNSHRDPRNFGTGGPVLGIPVKYSLLYSADGTDPTTGSYLSQFVSNRNVSTLGSTLATVATTYGTQAGFLALGDFGVRLTTAIPGNAEYTGFASAYFAYALTQRFLLQFYGLAPLAHLAATAYAPYALFDADTWAADACGVWKYCAPSATAAGEAVNALADTVVNSDFFASARPVVASTGVAGQVCVTLTIPSLLLTWPPSALLLAAFPVTLQGFVLPASPTAEWSGSATFSAVRDGPADTGLFPVVTGTAVEFEYFGVSATAAVPASLGYAVSSNSTSGLVGARLTFTVSVAAASSATLLFYLYCVAAGVATSTQAGLKATCITDLAAVVLPELADGPTVCASGFLSACASAGFTGVGASTVNALLVTGNATVCKCLYPTNAAGGANTAFTGGTTATTSGAALNTAAMCFNRFCTAPGIDLASIAATAGCSFPAVPPPVLDCAAMCGEYTSLLGASADVDTTVIDVAYLRDTCGVDVSQTTVAIPRYPLFLATLVLVALCVPLFVAVAAACAPTKQQLARPVFWIPAVAVFVLCCAAVTYAIIDLRGVASCAAGPTYDDDEGVHWPASTCTSAGFFGYLPAYTLPASFCGARTYCACGTLAGSGTRTCSGACKTCSADGLCTASGADVAPTIVLATVETRLDPLVCAFSGAVASCVVPACVFAFWKRTPAFTGKVAATVFLCLFLLAVSLVPVALQGHLPSFYRTNAVGIVDGAACTV